MLGGDFEDEYDEEKAKEKDGEVVTKQQKSGASENPRQTVHSIGRDGTAEVVKQGDYEGHANRRVSEQIEESILP